MRTLKGNLDVVKFKFDRFRANKKRKVRIWMPYDYNVDGEPYDVLYMFDGNNLFDCKTASYHMEWCIDETLLKYQEKYKVRPYIVVGLDCGKDRLSEYFPNFVTDEKFSTFDISYFLLNRKKSFEHKFGLKQRGEVTFDFLFDEVIPYVEKNYNVHKDASHRHIGGSSMGGLMTIYAYENYTDMFNTYFAYSIAFNVPYLIAKTEEVFEKFVQNFKCYDDKRICFCVGGVEYESTFVKYFDYFNSYFLTHSSNPKSYFFYKDSNMEHNEKQWAVAFDKSIAFLNNIKE